MGLIYMFDIMMIAVPVGLLTGALIVFGFTFSEVPEDDSEILSIDCLEKGCIATSEKCRGCKNEKRIY